MPHLLAGVKVGQVHDAEAVERFGRPGIVRGISCASSQNGSTCVMYVPSVTGIAAQRAARVRTSPPRHAIGGDGLFGMRIGDLHRRY